MAVTRLPARRDVLRAMAGLATAAGTGALLAG
ncbi:hypothetical protein FHX81_0801 [Saccharothrix saharensis]|uniref:Uncharacterized protein n=1 Tax=Saccharothrix saharensis TaxID=571190 RepID=A0A543J6S9_9PSEU|nr:hypothetical protein FHX81_0801 [Saccharothrix saharensis]